MEDGTRETQGDAGGGEDSDAEDQRDEGVHEKVILCESLVWKLRHFDAKMCIGT